MAKKTVRELVEEKYQHPEVRTAILEEIEVNGTAEKIESGELHLPGEHDAMRHVSGLAHQEYQKLRADQQISHSYDPEKHLEAQVKHKQFREGR